HSETGYLFDPDVRGDLARWVTELVESPSLRASMGESGPSMVAGRSWDVLTTQLVDHYEHAIASRAAWGRRGPALLLGSLPGGSLGDFRPWDRVGSTRTRWAPGCASWPSRRCSPHGSTPRSGVTPR